VPAVTLRFWEIEICAGIVRLAARQHRTGRRPRASSNDDIEVARHIGNLIRRLSGAMFDLSDRLTTTTRPSGFAPIRPQLAWLQADHGPELCRHAVLTRPE
jgi:hypothetical protein